MATQKSASGRTVYTTVLNADGSGEFRVVQDGRTTHTFSTMRETPTLEDKARDLAAREAGR